MNSGQYLLDGLLDLLQEKPCLFPFLGREVRGVEGDEGVDGIGNRLPRKCAELLYNGEKERRMGIDTGISWTDHTFNPWMGCTLDGEVVHEMPSTPYSRTVRCIVEPVQVGLGI